jgi:hypothetical protein
MAGEWLLPAIYALMPYQGSLPTEQLITHITAKWLLPSMYALMSLQMTLTTE